MSFRCVLFSLKYIFVFISFTFNSIKILLTWQTIENQVTAKIARACSNDFFLIHTIKYVFIDKNIISYVFTIEKGFLKAESVFIHMKNFVNYTNEFDSFVSKNV